MFNSELTAEEAAANDALDAGVRGGPEPEAATLETAMRCLVALFDVSLHGEAPLECKAKTHRARRLAVVTRRRVRRDRITLSWP